MNAWMNEWMTISPWMNKTWSPLNIRICPSCFLHLSQLSRFDPWFDPTSQQLVKGLVDQWTIAQKWRMGKRRERECCTIFSDKPTCYSLNSDFLRDINGIQWLCSNFAGFFQSKHCRIPKLLGSARFSLQLRTQKITVSRSSASAIHDPTTGCLFASTPLLVDPWSK